MPPSIRSSWLIKDSKLKDRLRAILDAYLADNVNARELKPDGTYVRLKVPDTEKKRDAQLEFVTAPADFN
ncbi:MAG TPA: hypothetical protein VHP99_00350 [Pyrinomonadaceae bacterium]|nr:hypothetical protein [Pyrinomonadaceae bacterium]